MLRINKDKTKNKTKQKPCRAKEGILPQVIDYTQRKSKTKKLLVLAKLLLQLNFVRNISHRRANEKYVPEFSGMLH